MRAAGRIKLRGSWILVVWVDEIALGYSVHGVVVWRFCFHSVECKSKSRSVDCFFVSFSSYVFLLRCISGRFGTGWRVVVGYSRNMGDVYIFSITNIIIT